MRDEAPRSPETPQAFTARYGPRADLIEGMSRTSAALWGLEV